MRVFHGWQRQRFRCVINLTLLHILLAIPICLAQPQPTAAARLPEPAASDVLAPAQWQAINQSIERALAWLASQQRSDGSFDGPDSGQPAITSLCVMAFLAGGHLPTAGRYGNHLNAAIDYILACQQPTGLICREGIHGFGQQGTATASFSGIYNHAISSVMLSEVYGMTDKERAARVRDVIERSVQFTRLHQIAPKRYPGDKGGWRYLYPIAEADSDILITSWCLMFLRSARNAGFNIPAEWIDDAIQYIQRCYEPQFGTFIYAIYGGTDHRTTRCITGAGILALSLGGLHETPIARAAGDWLLQYPFDNYNVCLWQDERYHYGVFYCAQAMFQLGGNYWRQFFPRTVQALLTNQAQDGGWAPESSQDDRQYGRGLPTSFAVLALATPYQLLPIYQR